MRACHSGPNFTNGGFYKIKVPGSTDEGHYTVTNEMPKFNYPVLP